MSWIYHQFEIRGKTAGALLDTGFARQPPIEQLPKLARFGVYCCLPAGTAFWDPNEQSSLDAIETDLLQLCSGYGNGWAIYVRRLDTPGLREYYLYFGENAELEKALPDLKVLHSGYRIEFESRPDPQWTYYQSWLKEGGVGG